MDLTIEYYDGVPLGLGFGSRQFNSGSLTLATNVWEECFTFDPSEASVSVTQGILLPSSIF